MRYLLVLMAVGLVLLQSGCGIYSFSGANTGAAKTVNVMFFENKARIVVPELSQYFTEELRSKFLRETALTVTNGKSDIEISGFISKYNTTFLAVIQDQPSKTRLTMGVKLRYVNNLEPDKSLEKNFEQFVDFDASENLSSIEQSLIEELSEKIITDIFNETVNSW